MEHEGLETHVRFRTQFHLQTDCTACPERILNTGLEVPAQGTATVAAEEFEDFGAGALRMVIFGLDWEEHVCYARRDEGDQEGSVIDDDELQSSQPIACPTLS